MIARPPRCQRFKARKANLTEIQTIYEGVDRASRIVLSHIVVERSWQQTALAAIAPSAKPAIDLPTPIHPGIMASVHVFTAWAWSRQNGRSPRSGYIPAPLRRLTLISHRPFRDRGQRA